MSNNIQGGTQDLRYNLSFIVQNSVAIGKPIIAVSIAYRLSAWGFLQSKEVTDSGNTNMGLRDQRLALYWIQENIAAFGGDPSMVTIWVSHALHRNDVWRIRILTNSLFSTGRKRWRRLCWMAHHCL